MAKMNLLVGNFSLRTEKIKTSRVEIPRLKNVAKKTEPEEDATAKKIKAEKEINPSKKRARQPAYSENKAPKEAKIRGQEKEIRFVII